MTHDPFNPFQKLAKEFAARCGKSGSAPGASSGISGVRTRNENARRGIEGGSREDENDSALFLHAVNRIKPLKNKEVKGGRTLGDMLGRDKESGKERIVPKREEKAGLVEASCSVQSAGSDEAAFLSAMGGLSAPADAPPEKIRAAALADDDGAALFSKAMQGVAPVSSRGRAVTAPAGRGKPAPTHDPVKALRDVLDGKVEFALHHTDEFLEGYVVGVDPLVLSRLRSGQYSPEKHLDLHGMNSRQAYDALTWFIKDAYQRGMRTVVVVTGRGRNSPDGVGVLRPLLQQWLCREPFKRVVLAFCTARPHDGGPGAVYVLLRKYKKSRGKIVWEHTPSDDDFPDI